MEVKERKIDLREAGHRCAELERQLRRRERLGTGYATGLSAASADDALDYWSQLEQTERYFLGGLGTV